MPDSGGKSTRGARRKSSAGEPVVTVVTVVYNGERHLEQAIRSVVAQEYPSLEYIVVDGGSRDGTLDIVRRYEDRIDLWVSEPDRGIYDAMNKGISLASGDLIGFLNCDDYYEEGAIRKVAEAYAAAGDPEAVVAGKWRLLFEHSGLAITATPSLRFSGGMPISHQATFVPKAVYRRFGTYDPGLRYAADLEMAVRLFRNGARFVLIPDVLANFRTGGASDRHYRESVREASEVIRKNLPIGTYLAYRVASAKFLFLTGVSKGVGRLFGERAAARLNAMYYRAKSVFSRHWE